MRAKLAASLFLAATSLWAAPPNTAVLDGRPLEYDASELRGTFTNSVSSFGVGNLITNLYVTWDADYLYVSLQGYESGNKLAVLIDVDPGNGTGAETTTNWVSGGATFLTYNEVGWQKSTNAGAVPFGLDYMVASEGFYNNIIRVTYDGLATPSTATVANIFDSGNGATPIGSPVDMVVQSDATQNELKGLEARIPWSELYSSNLLGRFGTVLPGDTIPVGASLRLFANLHNNTENDSYSASDAIPSQTSPNASYDLADGLLITDNYIDIPLDQDNDGQPDVAGGDVSAPWIRTLGGAQGQRIVFVQMNEPVKTTTATVPANWAVDGIAPTGVVQSATNAVLLYITNDLPAAALVKVASTNVEDVAGNQKGSHNYFTPAASGITEPLTVRFVLQTASGLGINPGASNFFLNGGSFPLEFGFPPSKSTQLSLDSGTLYYVDILFPPGTPRTLNYKYSGELTTTGTNTYEAVRLVNYGDAARVLTLPTNITSMVITDYLGAAAAPFRPTTTNTGYNALYSDTRRGDAGVRERVTMVFQLDLRNRNLAGVQRVIVQGSDPIRGFNNSSAEISDFGGTIGYDVGGGLELFDNGTNGDTNSGDGIYARTWSLTTNGLDSILVPGSPFNLVGGDVGTFPYFGSGWAARRSPRSIAYKYYVVKTDLTALESPAANIEFYLESTNTLTNIVFAPFVWENNALPLPPPSNSPTMRGVTFSGTVARVAFTNQPSELQHGIQISTNLGAGWLDYGTRGATTAVAGAWAANISNVGSLMEIYRAFAGPAKPTQPLYWEPNVAPSTGGVVRFWYNQHSRIFAGARDVGVTGTFNTPPWGTAIPMTFAGDGWWYYDLVITNDAPAITQLKPRRVEGTYEGGDNSYITRGFVRASWTPLSPTNEGSIFVTYDANGGVLAAATNVNIYRGFDESWFSAGNVPMTLVSGQTNVWEIEIVIPTNATTSMNFVFNNGASIWDSKDTAGGLNWRVFINQGP